jgi:uncharacterized lipoprotein YmbA
MTAWPRVLSISLLAALLSACATTPASRFFTLGDTQAVVLAPRSDLVLAVGPVDLPTYLDRPQIVSRSGSNGLEVDEFQRWGGLLDEEVTRLLMRHLADALQPAGVFTYPSRLAANSDYRLAVEIYALDGVRGGMVTLSAAWSLIDDRSGRVLETGQVLYRTESGGEDMAAYVGAITDLLGRLGDDMARRLADVPATS